MKVLGIIPSRYASTRFIGKPLVTIAGKSMIQRVYEQASKATSLSEVIVATDHKRIFNHVQSFGGKVLMTSENHVSGTDRCAEVAEKIENIGVVINIQGDEPFVNPTQIDQLAALFKDKKTSIATLIKKITKPEDLFSETVIKVVASTQNSALYFSRTAIPYIKGVKKENWLREAEFFKHIGIYAYRADVLRTVAKLKPTVLETREGLEQLRWMENGFEIHLSETQHESNSVDTPEDLVRMLREQNQS